MARGGCGVSKGGFPLRETQALPWERLMGGQDQGRESPDTEAGVRRPPLASFVLSCDGVLIPESETLASRGTS